MAVNGTSPDHDISVEDTDDDDENDFEDIYETAEIAIPFALAVVVVVVLCTVIAVAKMRKRRLRRQRNGQPSMPAISGGVPMSAAAYLNHEFRATPSLGSVSQPPGGTMVYHHTPPPLYTTPGAAIEQTPIPHYNPIPYTPMIEPPKYEDIFKTVSTRSDVNNEDMTTEESQEHINESGSHTSHSTNQRSNIGDKDSSLDRVTSHASDNKAFSDDNERSLNRPETSSPANTLPSDSQGETHIISGDQRHQQEETSLTITDTGS